MLEQYLVTALWSSTDGDYEKELGDKLTAIAKEFPEINIYVGDDNKLYFEKE